jgi:hypothetical protein
MNPTVRYAFTLASRGDFSREACEELVRLRNLVVGEDRRRIGQLFESQLAMATPQEADWLLALLEAADGTGPDPQR